MNITFFHLLRCRTNQFKRCRRNTCTPAEIYSRCRGHAFADPAYPPSPHRPPTTDRCAAQVRQKQKGSELEGHVNVQLVAESIKLLSGERK